MTARPRLFDVHNPMEATERPTGKDSEPNASYVLFGRDRELAELGGLLASDVRWLTIVGLGGVGKSRLARELGSRHAGVIGAALIALDAVGIESADELAVSIGARVAPAPMPGREAEPELTARLAEAGRIVLLLDNLEHLVGRVGPLLRRLLASLPGLTLIGSSRLPFELPEEVAWPLMPLASQGPQSPAAALLRARARGPRSLAGWDDEDALAALAARLDGVPLALELAAARARLVTPRALDALLDHHYTLHQPGREPRQATRYAAVEWATSQLALPERTALERLSVVPGTFDLGLAIAIIAMPHAEGFAVVERLARLSLIVPVVAVPDRFRILETVRELALSRLDSTARAEAYERMAAALLARFPSHIDPIALLPAEVTAVAITEQERLSHILRTGLERPGTTAVEMALRAGGILLACFRRTGFEPFVVRAVIRLLADPKSEEASRHVLLAAGLPVVQYLSDHGDSPEVDQLQARLEAVAAGDPRAMVRVRALRVILSQFRWDFQSVADLAAEPEVKADLALSALVLQQEIIARRALGQAEPERDDERLVVVIHALTERGFAEEALRAQINRAFLATHAGRTEIALDILEGEVAPRLPLVERFRPHVERERARALADRGALGAALGRFDTAVALFTEGLAAATQATTETHLDHVATALAAGRPDRAATSLSAARPATTFSRAFATALSGALGALHGSAPASGLSAEPPQTGTLEDEAIRLWALIAEIRLAAFGKRPLEPLEAALASPAAAGSFRVRLAQRIARAAFGLATGSSSVLGLAADGTAYRLGSVWHDLSTSPLVMRLFGAVALAAERGEPAPTRDALAEVLWSGERMSASSRTKRLHALVASLGEHGLPLEIAEGRIGLQPGLTPLRVALPLWPGHEIRRGRGRGRPKKISESPR